VTRKPKRFKIDSGEILAGPFFRILAGIWCCDPYLPLVLADAKTAAHRRAISLVPLDPFRPFRPSPICAKTDGGRGDSGGQRQASLPSPTLPSWAVLSAIESHLAWFKTASYAFFPLLSPFPDLLTLPGGWYHNTSITLVSPLF